MTINGDEAMETILSKVDITKLPENLFDLPLSQSLCAVMETSGDAFSSKEREAFEFIIDLLQKPDADDMRTGTFFAIMALQSFKSRDSSLKRLAKEFLSKGKSADELLSTIEYIVKELKTAREEKTVNNSEDEYKIVNEYFSKNNVSPAVEEQIKSMSIEELETIYKEDKEMTLILSEIK